jgi:hypothetical protein
LEVLEEGEKRLTPGWEFFRGNQQMLLFKEYGNLKNNVK